MPTTAQIKYLEKKLKEYKKRFLTKECEDLDEASTRLMVNHFLTDILGYAEFEEIKTEYAISGGYADYVIQIGRKKHFIIEVKAISLDLSDKHLRQATNYAANEGIDWIFLTNGSSVMLYRVLFNKPISVKRVFKHDIGKEKNLHNASKDIALLTKKSVENKKLEEHWERFKVIEPEGLSKLMYHKSLITCVRRVMREKTGLSFSEMEVLDAMHGLITKQIENTKPIKPIERRTKKSQTKKPHSEEDNPIPNDSASDNIAPNDTLPSND